MKNKIHAAINTTAALAGIGLLIFGCMETETMFEAHALLICMLCAVPWAVANTEK